MELRVVGAGWPGKGRVDEMSSNFKEKEREREREDSQARSAHAYFAPLCQGPQISLWTSQWWF